MSTRNAHIHRSHLDPSHDLGLLNGLANGLDGAVDIDHHALLEATGRMGTDPNHVDGTITFYVANDGTDFRGSDVETNDDMLSPAAHSVPSSCISLWVR